MSIYTGILLRLAGRVCGAPCSRVRQAVELLRSRTSEGKHERCLGAIAHGEGELDWAVMAREAQRASGAA